jgi:hypothetical protein
MEQRKGWAMKAYILKQEDFEKLLSWIDRDPKHGYTGGSSQTFTKQEEEAFNTAHRFYNYQIRRWIDEVQK